MVKKSSDKKDVAKKTTAKKDAAKKNTAKKNGEKKKKEPMVTCRTPSPGVPPTKIVKWKYELIERAILATVPQDDIGIMFRQLPSMVRTFLSKEDRARLGSVYFYTTVVKLDLEVQGRIERIPGMRPQYLKQTG